MCFGIVELFEEWCDFLEGFDPGVFEEWEEVAGGFLAFGEEFGDGVLSRRGEPIADA
jgi:hypothetical protein